MLVCPDCMCAKTVEDGEHLVRLEINVLNQDGQGTTPGHAVVVLPSREG